jgi:GNAT superfamily N-acetyltransferase
MVPTRKISRRYVAHAANYLGPMIEHVLRPVTTGDADIAKISALLQAVFPGSKHFTEEALRWQYRDAPDGQVVGFNAWQEDDLAAHYVAIPIEVVLNGKSEKGLLSLNTATHPAHQGKGLFTKLANATYALGAAQGFGFVIGVANANSTHGFIKKLGFQLIAPLRAMIGIGPLPLRKGTGDVRYEQRRSQATLAWRLGHPTYRYHQARGGSGEMLLSERTQFGCRFVMHPAMDIPSTEVPSVRKAPWRKLWIGLDPEMHWRGSLYVNIPMRFRPSPLNLIFKDLSGQNRTLKADQVRFNALDFDIL